jgi:2-carboxy-D-arabinitol-1-phosphatase
VLTLGAVLQVQQKPLPSDAEDLGSFWQRTGRAWRSVHAAATEGEGGTCCVVGHAAVHAALVCHCLKLSKQELGRFRMSTAGLTVIEFPFDDGTGVIRCHNYTAHLGRWAVPISRDNEVQACGIDGCF